MLQEMENKKLLLVQLICDRLLYTIIVYSGVVCLKEKKKILKSLNFSWKTSKHKAYLTEPCKCV